MTCKLAAVIHPMLTSMAFVPTSSTTAPSFIQSPLTISGCPQAAMTISACWQNLLGSGVREWTTVTVASRCCSNSDNGIPTMLLRPMTTACLPEIVTPCRSSSSRQPCKYNNSCLPSHILMKSTAVEGEQSASQPVLLPTPDLIDCHSMVPMFSFC